MTTTHPFFITGLPRSRTAWLANLFTTGETVCWHDIVGRVPIEEWPAMFNSGICGLADSGLLFNAPAVIKLFPDSRWVIVLRDFDQAWESLVRFVAAGPWGKERTFNEESRKAGGEIFAAGVEAIENSGVRVAIVEFDKLDDPSTIANLWTFCLPGVPLSTQRLDILQRLNVQTDQRKNPLADIRKENLCLQCG